MKKTSVYLEPEVDRGLSRRAEALGKSKAQVIRDALEKEAAKAPGRKRLRAIAVGNGPGDVADSVDRHLRESGFGDS